MIIKRTFTLNLILPVLITVSLYLCMNFFDWVIDDLYIYFRYVDNFVSGNGIVFNKGEYVEGFSSFLWFMYLSMCGVLNLPLEASAKYSGLAISVLNSILAYRISSKIMPGRFALVAPVMMLFSLPYMLWSVSGFEVMLYIFLILSSVFIVVAGEDALKRKILPVFLFLITITRPEGILTAIAFLVYMFFYKREFRDLKFMTISFSSLFLMFILFRFFYFGDILPNTYYAKIGHNLFGNYELRSYKNGFMYFLFFFEIKSSVHPGSIVLNVYGFQIKT